MNNITKLIIAGAITLVLLILGLMAFGTNDNGYRTVVQYPNGHTFVVLEPSWYLTMLGDTIRYQDVITYDYERGANESDPTVDVDGINVRYQDGGLGTIHGIARFELPDDEETMLMLHREFRSNEGLANKLLRNVTDEAMNLTAGLMTSEDAYAVDRGSFSDWSRQQVQGGKFRTVLKEITEVDELTGRRVTKSVPEIAYGDNGLPIQYAADLQRYGINVSGFQITDWNFEQKTLDQITEKREATMAIITARANAERAQQDAITAEEQGKANVMKAKYEKEVEKERAVVDAQRQAEVAVIAAQQNVDVAEQQKLQAEQLKLAAAEYKEEQILRGEGDAAYKQLVLEADGALAQKLEAYIKVQQAYAREIGKQRWVPDVQMGASGVADGGNAATELVELLTAKTAQDLRLDMTMPKGATIKENFRE